MLCYVFLEIPNLHHFVIKMLTHLAKKNLFYLTRNLRSDLYWFLFTDKKKNQDLKAKSLVEDSKGIFSYSLPPSEPSRLLVFLAIDFKYFAFLLQDQGSSPWL